MPHEREEHQKLLASLREALGETDFAAAEKAGATLSFTAACQTALDWLGAT